MNPKSLTVFFPAYNDGRTIGPLVLAALQLLPQITDDYEVLVVNDGSQDHTAAVLAELARRHPQVRVLHHDRNRGYGAALRSGFAAARKDWVFYTDGDAQYNPSDLGRLLAVWNEKVDIVTGYKIARHDPLYRVVCGRIYHSVVALAFRLRIRDVDCDFRLIRRRVLASLALESATGTIGVELMKKIQDAGYLLIEVPVPHYDRPSGTSQFFRPCHLWRMAGQLVQLWWQLVAHPVPAALPATLPAAAAPVE